MCPILWLYMMMEKKGDGDLYSSSSRRKKPEKKDFFMYEKIQSLRSVSWNHIFVL